MRKFLVVSVVIFLSFSSIAFAAPDLDAGIQELALQISKNMASSNKKKIAIIEFSDLDGRITSFGQFLAEELVTQLFITSPGQFEVVERRQLMKVLSEQKLTMSGLLDANAMESVGKILGIEAIVTGSITDLGNNIKINARLIGVDNAKIFAVASTSIPKVGTVADLMGKEAVQTQIFPASEERTNPSTQTRQQASAKNTPMEFGNFRIGVESLKMTNDGVMASVSYVNLKNEELQITLDYPPKEKGFAVDNLGNEYSLEKSGGMSRLHSDANRDLKMAYNPATYSTFLSAPPGGKVYASFLFKKVKKANDPHGEEGKEKPTSFTLTIGHYVRPVKNFDPKKSVAGAFGLSATLSNIKLDEERPKIHK
ncbi:MAG: FlgO family outer membrane protein [bacterium]